MKSGRLGIGALVFAGMVVVAGQQVAGASAARAMLAQPDLHTVLSHATDVPGYTRDGSVTYSPGPHTVRQGCHSHLQIPAGGKQAEQELVHASNQISGIFLDEVLTTAGSDAAAQAIIDGQKTAYSGCATFVTGDVGSGGSGIGSRHSEPRLIGAVSAFSLHVSESGKDGTEAYTEYFYRVGNAVIDVSAYAVTQPEGGTITPANPTRANADAISLIRRQILRLTPAITASKPKPQPIPTRTSTPTTAPAPPVSCTTTSSGSCIRGGEFCPVADEGEAGTAADGRTYTCIDSDNDGHPHWE